MIKVLLIGNGPSVLEQKMGERIDSHEFNIVCRINRGHKQDDGSLNEGYEEFVGNRCDWWVCSDLRTSIALKRVEEYNNILVFYPKFKLSPKIYDIFLPFNNLNLISPKCEEQVNSIINFSPKWPSTGIIAIQHLINNSNFEVTIYGFDTYDVKYSNLHYYGDTPNKYKQPQNKDHNPQKEKFYIEYMIKNNKIKLLK